MLGRRLEPQGVGFAALIAPAYAIGGATGVAIFLAAVAALAFVLAARLARRIVPEPWATAAALVVGLSPPVLAHATAVYPELAAGAMLAGAVLCALRVRERPDLGSAVVGATLLALLPWLGPKYLLPAAPVAVALVRWTARRGRRTAALAAAEIMVASLVVYATINDRLYSGLVPSAVAASGEPPTGADSLGDYAGRAPRLAALWLDRDVGLVRWAPVLLLVLFSVWLLWRARSQHLARVVAEHADAEAAAGLSLLRVRGGAAGRGVRRADPDRRLVPGPPARRRLPGRRRPRGLGAAARAAHGSGARRAHAAVLGVAGDRAGVRRAPTAGCTRAWTRRTGRCFSCCRGSEPANGGWVGVGFGAAGRVVQRPAWRRHTTPGHDGRRRGGLEPFPSMPQLTFAGATSPPRPADPAAPHRPPRPRPGPGSRSPRSPDPAAGRRPRRAAAWTSGSSCSDASRARRRRTVASPSTSFMQVAAAALGQQPLGLDEGAVLGELLLEQPRRPRRGGPRS